MTNEPGPSTREAEQLVSVFSDAKGHMQVAEIIRKHLVGKEDVREMALSGIDLHDARSVLDLGCGYGFFTKALKNRVHPDALVTGLDKHESYREHYMNACRHAGLKGMFLAGGADILHEVADNLFDLVICSYALYFFPGYIRHIARVLKKGSYFVAITHSRPHMRELTTLVAEILHEIKGREEKQLPYGDLISNFSNENGLEMLSEWFGQVRQVEYKNTLVFSEDDMDDFDRYFHFKKAFFISRELGDGDLVARVLSAIRMRIKQGPLEITKDDMIFICSEPRKLL